MFKFLEMTVSSRDGCCSTATWPTVIIISKCLFIELLLVDLLFFHAASN